MDVCQPSHVNGSGKPVNMESGASIGKAYHHLVKTAKEITVSGIMSLNVSCFMLPFEKNHNPMPIPKGQSLVDESSNFPESSPNHRLSPQFLFLQ